MWFFRGKRYSKLEEELRTATDRIALLEKKMEVTSMTLQNVQSALIAISKTQEGVANDVRSIQEVVSAVFHELENPSNMWVSGDSKYEA